jgi:predicted phosphodiesterase
MLIQIASDLHLEHVTRRFPDERVVAPCGADVTILAGDIHSHARAIEAFREWPNPVIYVLGNHEYYGADMDSVLDGVRRASRGTPVRVLENDVLVMDGVRFVGTTLWTSFELGGPIDDATLAEIVRPMPDFEIIETQGGTLTPAWSADLHRVARAFLARHLEQPFDGPTVVITHHAPHPNSIHPQFAGDPLNRAFISDLSDLMGHADLWVHGHVHNSFDYQLHGTRVLANPRGYPLNLRAAPSLELISWENPHFNPCLSVHL